MTQGNILYVKHIPSCLTNDEKEELLKYFGAIEVRVMSDRGRLKHSAFATFEDSQKAKNAIDRLHQTKIYDSVLSVEYAKEPDINLSTNGSVNTTKGSPVHGLKNPQNIDANSTKTRGQRHGLIELEPVAPHLGLNYPTDPGLKYIYPEANADVVLNICCALLAIPKFYTQVLHLMNKMNMVPPFSPASTVPQMLMDRVKNICNLTSGLEDYAIHTEPVEVPKEPDKIEVVEMSESESELESSESEGHSKLKTLDMDVPERVIKTRKRKKIPGNKERKRRKLKNTTPNTQPVNVQGTVSSSNFHDVQAEAEAEDNDAANEPTTRGFGKLLPQNVPINDQEPTLDEAEEKVLKDYITKKQLDAGRMSKKEMTASSLFENYKEGDPTCRLYVKNLSKHVTEKDLQFIFGSFVNFEDEDEQNMFDIQVLKQGRMKGQAFVGFLP